MFLKIGKTILSSLFKKPETLMYPVVPRNFVDRSRGHISIEIDKCIFCGICQKKCPTMALDVQKNDRTWAIERLRCITCDACVDVCPKKCLHMEKGYSAATVTASQKDLFKGPEKPAAPSTPTSTP